ncbi:unnamed protein product [Cylicocyclus nassatus]|uniref:Uncharacterized protein n=1 Tax=Cylicocyclus nassatus TaxID=53992 RepID=A0AA36GJX5_CYLNA|nr:unnamed protein product [Cylicocyclus nassatus]
MPENCKFWYAYSPSGGSMSSAILLRSDLEHLEDVEQNLLKRLSEIGARDISEIAFAVGRSSEGLYLRIDFMPYVDKISEQVSKKSSEDKAVAATNVAAKHAPMAPTEKTLSNDVGVSCCGDFAGVDDVPITLEIHFKTYGSKGDVCIQTGTPTQS